MGRFTVNILGCYLLAYGIARPLVHRLLAGFGPVCGTMRPC